MHAGVVADVVTLTQREALTPAQQWRVLQLPRPEMGGTITYATLAAPGSGVQEQRVAGHPDH